VSSEQRSCCTMLHSALYGHTPHLQRIVLPSILHSLCTCATQESVNSCTPRNCCLYTMPCCAVPRCFIEQQVRGDEPSGVGRILSCQPLLCCAAGQGTAGCFVSACADWAEWLCVVYRGGAELREQQVLSSSHLLTCSTHNLSAAHACCSCSLPAAHACCSCLLLMLSPPLPLPTHKTCKRNLFGWVAQITEMARMTPGQRLELLKEVGGTKVYEERRRESVKIMAETESRRLQV
jgi:hypothetical protein